MKLVECYIENFGKLHQFTYKFQDGLNTINELNGWGKSTFAAFIRAMFYGMQVSAKKNLDEVERKKYNPWQGGKFGGYIIFKLNDKEYKIERFFAGKEKDDTFAVYDQGTGLVSSDFTRNIGEDIFKLDRTAYSRSTYIPQNAIGIEANDSINAKLSNLIENDNDINNFDSAMTLLKNNKKEYVKIGGKGKLDVIKNKIASLEDKLNICQAKRAAFERWNENLEEIIFKKKDAKENLQSVKSHVEAASKYEGRAAKMHQYNEWSGTEKKLQADLAPLSSFFCENIPTDEELKICDDISSELLKVQGELKSYELTDYEKSTQEKFKAYFSKGVPEEKEISTCEDLIAKYRENKIKISANELTEVEKLKKAELDNFFAKGDPDESEVDRFVDKISKINELKGNITTEKSKLEILKNVQVSNNSTQENKGKTGTGLMVIAAIIVALGIGLMFKSLFAGFGCITIGVILFVVAIAMNQKQKGTSNTESTNDKQKASNLEIQKFIDDLTAQKNSIEEELNNFLLRFAIEVNPNNYYSSLTTIKTKASEYRNIITKLNNKESAATKNDQSDIIKKVNAYLEPYCDDLALSMEQKESIWKMVKSSRIEYLKICDKHYKYEKTNENFNSLKSRLFKFLKTYFNEIDENPSTNINTLKDRYKEYVRLSKELENYSAKRVQFENENDVESFKNIEVPEYTLIELQDSEKTLYDELDNITDEENNARKQINTLSDDADRCPELEGEIEQLKEELSFGEKRLDILEKTLQCLENAKDHLAIHYMDSMNQGFQRYVSILDNGTLGEIHMDVKLNVNISAYGSQKSMDYFSTGYKDLIGICTRFALVDALFENEKPFIILDDPFANLDGKKLNNVLGMIEQISKKYQIIYFVCHESRVASNC